MVLTDRERQSCSREETRFVYVEVLRVDLGSVHGQILCPWSSKIKLIKCAYLRDVLKCDFELRVLSWRVVVAVREILDDSLMIVSDTCYCLQDDAVMCVGSCPDLNAYVVSFLFTLFDSLRYVNVLYDQLVAVMFESVTLEYTLILFIFWSSSQFRSEDSLSVVRGKDEASLREIDEKYKRYVCVLWQG